MMTIVKICGVTRPEDAYHAAQEGADYIGIIFSPKSPRNLAEGQAKLIVESIQNKATPVAVFTDSSAKEMERISDLLGIEIVQLHSKYAIEEGRKLRNKARIFVNPETAYGIDEEKDFILFDSRNGESFGPLFPTQFKRWFIAGGLNPKNVKATINDHHPFGVDVSGGVESAPGIKDARLVAEFIRLAKEK